jgi:isoleucyl-tRNA synthetase/very-short-patch-repair endonuclease
MNDSPKAGAAKTDKSGPDYSASLYLPQTDFPMRAGLPKKEPEILARWEKNDLYRQLRAAGAGKRKFILHDGPPYANGNIHIGHALNKILKDLVTRSQQMLDKDSNYVPGWDCHGLPIEWKIEEENYRSKGKPKPDFAHPDAMIAFRRECRAYADHWVKVQGEEFRRLGVTGDWKNPYLTMTYPAEAQIAREIMKFAANGLLYRGSKPVMWSVVEKTALAEAEVEYEDHTSDTILVKFPIAGGLADIGPASVVIWTTTPWTIPGNRAISFSSKIAYGAYRVEAAPAGNWAAVGDVYILADKLAGEVMRQAKVERFARIGDASPDFLSRVDCKHPFYMLFPGQDADGNFIRGYDFDVPLLDGEHVTDETGTGFVHTAPSHGREDFDIWMASTRLLHDRGVKTAIPTPVDADGFYTDDAPGFAGARVITDKGQKGDANERVMAALVEAGALLARGRLKHQYPHSWRSKKPVIFRNTPQWFIAMDEAFAADPSSGLRPPSPERGEGARASLNQVDRDPSSGPSGHLLPQGEKAPISPQGAPSPLAGEGGARSATDEGAAKHRVDDRLRGYAKDMRSEPTEAENVLWTLLRGRRFSGFKFRRQVPIGNYIADFVCYEARLVLEADGGQHGESRHDEKRDAWFKEQGFRVRRFWNHEIFTQRTMVEETLWHDLQADRDPSSGLRPPSPARGEGANDAGALPSPLAGERSARSATDEGTVRQDTLRERALSAIRATQWVPAAGENRITGMIANRPDWVVSRQRAWGVPIAVFVKKGSHNLLVDEKVNARIADAFEQEGADAWFAAGAAARFLAPEHDPADYEKIDDVLDVWFDSGSTHAFVLEDAKHFPTLAGIHSLRDGGPDEVMYLEGSDQHRGWFHSSLLESCGTRGRAPYDAVLTHGFTLDEHGRKMSKSLGNVTVPQKVIAEHGADILRLWVGSVDYSDDQRIGPEILKSITDNYRKLRNTIRWMLGSLAHFSASERVALADMPELERLMLHRLAELDGHVRAAYAAYEYNRVVTALTSFMTGDLSAFYFDIRKDALYCDAPSSVTRRAALTVIDDIFRRVVTWLAPVLAFTCEEAWLSRYPSETGTVHTEVFPVTPADWRDEALAAKWKTIRNLRRVVTGALEIERAEKRIGSSLEAAPVLHIADDTMRKLAQSVDFAEICITSGVTIAEGEGPADAFRLPDVAGVAVVPRRAEGRKCARSWKISPLVGADPDFPDVSPRDAQALRELKALGRWPV